MPKSPRSPNTTSRIQPLDAGIIAAFKKKYRARQYQMALLESELGSTDIYKLDILQAIKLSQEIWKDIGSSTIKNCSRHTGLVDWKGEEVADSDDTELDKELEATLKKANRGEEEALVEEEETEDTVDTPSPPAASVELKEAPGSVEGVVEEQLKTLKSAQCHGSRESEMKSAQTEKLNLLRSSGRACLSGFQGNPGSVRSSPDAKDIVVGTAISATNMTHEGVNAKDQQPWNM